MEYAVAEGIQRGLGATEEVKEAGALVGRPWSCVCNDAEIAGTVGDDEEYRGPGTGRGGIGWG